MSDHLFETFEHVIPCQHIREFRRGSKSEQDVLQLVVKEYRPRNNLNPAPDSVTIIFMPGNSEPAGAHWPLWDDLLAACKTFKIRAIWAVDPTNKGESNVLNEHLLGDDPALFDLSRDVLHMVNVLRDRMHRPIVGAGHSSGATSMLHAAVLHPRLFHSLVLMEPIFAAARPGSTLPLSVARRRDLWPSRAAADAYFRRHRFYSTYEHRMLDAWIACQLRDTPTATHPPGAAPAGSVTLKIPKAQELWLLGRPNFAPRAPDEDEDRSGDYSPLDHHDRLMQPGARGDDVRLNWMRPEVQQAWAEVAQLRPGVLWLYGADSPVNPPQRRADTVALTGTAPSGGGGLRAGLVERVDVPGAAHVLPQQKPTECAAHMADWLEREVRRFRHEEEYMETHWFEKSARDGAVISDALMKRVDTDICHERPVRDKYGSEKL